MFDNKTIMLWNIYFDSNFLILFVGKIFFVLIHLTTFYANWVIMCKNYGYKTNILKVILFLPNSTLNKSIKVEPHDTSKSKHNVMNFYNY